MQLENELCLIEAVAPFGYEGWMWWLITYLLVSKTQTHPTELAPLATLGISPWLDNTLSSSGLLEGAEDNAGWHFPPQGAVNWFHSMLFSSPVRVMEMVLTCLSGSDGRKKCTVVGLWGKHHKQYRRNTFRGSFGHLQCEVSLLLQSNKMRRAGVECEMDPKVVAG